METTVSRKLQDLEGYLILLATGSWRLQDLCGYSNLDATTYWRLLDLKSYRILEAVAHATWHHSSPRSQEQQLLLSSLKRFYKPASINYRRP